MPYSSVHRLGAAAVGLALALVASLLLVTQWPDAEAAQKKKRFTVECVGSVALLYERGEFLDSAVVGSLGCTTLRREAQ